MAQALVRGGATVVLVDSDEALLNAAVISHTSFNPASLALDQLSLRVCFGSKVECTE